MVIPKLEVQVTQASVVGGLVLDGLGLLGGVGVGELLAERRRLGRGR